MVVNAPTTATANLFGVEIHSLSFDETVRTVLGWIDERDGGARFVLTPNVNHLVLYQRHEGFRTAYGKAALVVPDGRYTTLLGRLLGQPLLETINGSDLIPALFSAYEGADDLRVFLLGAMPGVADRASFSIEERWRSVRVVGTYSPPFGFEKDELEAQRIIKRINAAKPDLLVLGISPPKQEVWIADHQHGLNCSVAICAGATIDFLAGEKARAPRWMQRFRLEWLHRMLSEPRRLVPRYFSDGLAILRLLSGELVRKLKRRMSAR